MLVYEVRGKQLQTKQYFTNNFNDYRSDVTCSAKYNFITRMNTVRDEIANVNLTNGGEEMITN